MEALQQRKKQAAMERATTDLSHALSEANRASPNLQQELAAVRLALAQAREQLAAAESQLQARDRQLASLRSSHELLESTLDAANDGIATLQFADDTVYYNIRFVELWGIPEEKISELEKFEEAVVGRELKMIQLERELIRIRGRREELSEAEEL